jgi:putative spermidine/putrescine transport system permease protein
VEYSLLDRLGRLVTRALLLVGLVVMLSPILSTLMLSLGEDFSIPPTSLTLRWYANFLARREFLEGLQVSLLLGLWSVVVATVLATGVAFTLTRHSFRGRAAINFLVMSPITMPKVAIGVALFLFFLAINFRGASVRLGVVHLILTFPYVFGVVMASMQGVDPAYEQAAANLGASPWETFRRITLPLIRPGLVAGGIFAFVVSFDEVTASVFLTDARTVTFPVVLFSYLAQGTLDPTVAAASSFMFLFVGVLVVVLTRQIGLARALGVGRPK